MSFRQLNELMMVGAAPTFFVYQENLSDNLVLWDQIARMTDLSDTLALTETLTSKYKIIETLYDSLEGIQIIDIPTTREDILLSDGLTINIIKGNNQQPVEPPPEPPVPPGTYVPPPLPVVDPWQDIPIAVEGTWTEVPQ